MPSILLERSNLLLAKLSKMSSESESESESESGSEPMDSSGWGNIFIFTGALFTGVLFIFSPGVFSFDTGDNLKVEALALSKISGPWSDIGSCS